MLPALLLILAAGPPPPLQNDSPALELLRSGNAGWDGTALWGGWGETVTSTGSGTFPRDCYDATTGTCWQLTDAQPCVTRGGMPVRSAVVNLLVRSDAFGTTWIPDGVTVSANQTTDPWGGSTADKISEDGTDAAHEILGLVDTVTNSNYSVYGKAGTLSWIRLADNSVAHSAIFHVGSGGIGNVTGTGTTSQLEWLDDGWFRASMQTPTGSALMNVMLSKTGAIWSYPGDGGYVYLVGAQATSTTYRQDYCGPTAADSMTCGPDRISVPWAAAVVDAEGCASARVTFGPIVTGGRVLAGSGGIPLYVPDSTTVSIFDNTTEANLNSGFSSLAGRTVVLRSWWHAASSEMGVEVVGEASKTVAYDGTIASATLAVGSAPNWTLSLNAKISDVKLDTSRFGCQGGFSLPDARPGNKVATIGDSITGGLYGDGGLTPYPSAMLATKGFPWTVHNYGVGGDGTTEILAQWTNSVKAKGYGYVAVMGGINDIDNADASVAWPNLTQVANEARDAGMKVVLMNVLGGCHADGGQRDVDTVNLNASIAAYCALGGANLSCVDTYTALGNPAHPQCLDGQYDYAGDSLHPTQAGLNVISTLVSAQIP